jgi:hypothetical protein
MRFTEEELDDFRAGTTLIEEQSEWEQPMIYCKGWDGLWYVPMAPDGANEGPFTSAVLADPEGPAFTYIAIVQPLAA